VGYDPGGGIMVTIRPGSWMKRCDNGLKHGVCNWVVDSNKGETLCMACRMNRTIPDLTSGRNRMLWGRMEIAKRRLIHTLLRMGITLPSKKDNAKSGLAFDIVSTMHHPELTMGHLNGVITVNLEEADDTYRQINRQQLGENSRTLLGHFRHESGHYVWQRWLSEKAWDDPLRIAFREVFGDEWKDYAGSLGSYYQNGGTVGWEKDFISAYASSHPWEDWSETWGHYLQILEGLETCEGLGIEVKRIALPMVQFPLKAGALPSSLPQSAEADAEFLTWLQNWVCISTTLNEIATSLGEAPLYPYVISVRVAQKLRLVHHCAKIWGGR
jgi:hypothetical protein